MVKLWQESWEEDTEAKMEDAALDLLVRIGRGLSCFILWTSRACSDVKAAFILCASLSHS